MKIIQPCMVTVRLTPNHRVESPLMFDQLHALRYSCMTNSGATKSWNINYLLAGQCYDGASAIKGKRKGLKTLILDANPKASYVHCYAHSLQLAIQDSVKQSKLMSTIFDVYSEISKLIRKFPKTTPGLQQLKKDIPEPSISMRALCPTRLLSFFSGQSRSCTKLLLLLMFAEFKVIAIWLSHLILLYTGGLCKQVL